MADIFKSFRNWLGSLFGGPREARRYADLVRRLRGDRDGAERLIELERQRRPSAGRASWIDNALYRLERDNR